MRKLKLFFACLLMAVLSIGQMWATIDANSTWTATAFGDIPDGATVVIINNFGNSFANATVTKAPAKVAASFNSTTKKITVSTTGKSLDDIAWTVEQATNGTKFWVYGSTTNLLGLSKTNDNNAVAVNTTSNASYNEFVMGSNGKLLKYYNAGRYVGEYVSGSDWRSYTTENANNYKSGTTEQALTFYVLDENEGPLTPTCATPTFDPEDGETFTDDIDVEIASATEGVTIYYTTDGNDPTTSSSVYSSALNFTETTTLKAMAVKAGYDNSAVATATYTKIVSVPGYEIDFESELVSYVDWNFANFTKTNETITAHGGSYFAKTNGTNTASVTTKAKVANPGILTYYISKIGTNTNANSKWKARVSENGTDWTIVGTEYAAASDVTAGTWKTCTADLTSYSNVYVQVYYDGTTAVRTIDDISLTTVTPGTVATPTISGATPFVTTTTITLECTTDGASIYYTTNGTDPTASSTLYENPFVLNASANVKAIAIKGTGLSSIASKEFTKVTSYTTLADIYAKAVEVGETATDIYVTFDSWQISAKNSNNAFLTDGTNGAVIYGSGHGFNAGDVLTGTAACKVQLYRGFAELTVLNKSTAGLTVTSGTVGDPVIKTWSQLSAVNTGALVKLENLTYDGTSLSDGENTIPTYTTFYTASFESGKKYNLSGVYQYYNTNGQILPRNAADVEEIIETYSVTYNNTPDHGTLTIKNGDDVVTSGSSVNEGTVLTIVTTPAEGYKLAGVTVNSNAYTESTLTLSENVTIAATFEENLAPLVTSYDLSEIGVVTSHLNGERVGDKVNLPLTAASCSKTFVGWSANASCAVAPEYAPGAQYTLEANNILYAVYANPAASATWNVATSLEAGDVVVISTNTGYTAHEMKTAGAISSSLFSCLASTYNADNSQIIALAEGTLQFTVGGNATDGWTLMNGTKYLKVTAAKKVNLVDDEETWNISFSGNNATLAPATGDLTDYSIQYNYNTGNDRFTAYNTNQVPISLYKQVASYENYSTDCQAQVATPTFSPVAGTYTTVQNVTIACETEDVTIYYTTNGDDPTTSSTEYTAAIPVNESMTIKAIAVKSGMANSAIASAAYTINLPLSTMDQIFAAATAAGGTATDVNIAFGNWVVSGVSTNGKNVFVTDGTKGFIIYDGGGEMGFAVGNVLSGTVACKVQLFKGSAELTALSSSTEGLNVATDGVITPVAKAISELGGINTGAPVIINSVQFDGEYLTDGANSIKPYTTLYADAAFTENKYYNVTGIYQQFDTTKEILPRSADDIEEVSLSDPEISYTPASATIELGEELPGTVFANPHELAISYTSDNEAVATVSNTGVIALGTETGIAVITAHTDGEFPYAAGNATYTITVNPASVTENVVILAVYDTKYYAMSTTIPGEAFTAIEVEYDGSKVTVNSEADKMAIQWTRKISGDNTTFQTKGETPMYMKGTSSGAAMSLNANVCNWSWDGTNEYYCIGSRSFFYQNGVGFKNYATSNIKKTGYSDKAQVIAIAAENIVITSKVSAELAYDPESDEITEGDAWSAPALVNPHTVTITSYASDNESVATVEGGVIALAGGIGTAHITAHFDGDASYLEGDAVYTITVNAPAPVATGTSYAKVKSTDDITADGEYLIVYETASKAFNGNLATLDGENNTVDVVISEEKIAGTSAIDAAVFTIDAANGDLRSNSGYYVGVGGYSNGMTQSDVAGTYANVFAINANENVDITITFAGGDMHLLYNTGGRFRYYKAENSTNKAIQLYKKETATPVDPTPDYTRGVMSGNYGTICLPKAGTISGATLFEIAYKGGGLIYVDEILNGEMEAGVPYIFYATSDQLSVVYNNNTDEPVEASHVNGLYGFYNLSNMATDAADKKDLDKDQGNYILYDNQYWLVSGRDAFIYNFRAYIKLGEISTTAPEPQQGAPRRRVAMTVNGEQTATGIGELNASETPVKMMIDGQMYILRGEKMFDATGRLVK